MGTSLCSQTTLPTMKAFVYLLLPAALVALTSTEAAALDSAEPVALEGAHQCTEYCQADSGDFALACCSHYFCKCEGGVGWIIQCPADLYFVESIDQCDYKENVHCCTSL